MITQGPFSLTLNVALPLHDPGATSNHPATAVQLQNASPFIIDVNIGGAVLTIQSFTAQTVGVDSRGQTGSVTPIESNTQDVTAANVLTVVWLLAGEQSPMLDGSLTAAAITAGLEGQGIAGVDVISSTIVVAGAGGVGAFGIGTGNFRIWNLGFLILSATVPTKGAVAFEFINLTSTVYDSVDFRTGASARLAGMAYNNGTGGSVDAVNWTDVSLTCFLDYSAA